MDFSNDYEEWKNLLEIHVNTGEFFRKFRKHFKIIYYGHLSYMSENRHLDSPYEDIICHNHIQEFKIKNFIYFFMALKMMAMIVLELLKFIINQLKIR